MAPTFFAAAAATTSLFGGGGNDRLEGGEGNDTAGYIFTGANIADALEVNLVFGTVKRGLAERDTLFSIENIIASGARDLLVGNDEDNIIDGGNGANQIFGGGGDDSLDAGLDDDIIDGGAGNDDDRLLATARIS